MIMVKDIITQAIHSPLHPLIVSLLLVRMNNLMKNEDTTDIRDESAAMIQHPNQLESSIYESKLHRISKMVMKEAVEDKNVELMQSGTMTPAKDVDVLCLINTSDLYRLIDEGINIQ